MPFLSAAAAIAEIAGAGTGVGEAIATSGTAKQGAQEQNQIAAQEAGTNAQIARQNQQSLANKQAIYDKLFPFFQQYMSEGSPFLSRIQGASADQNAQQFGNAAGELRGQMQTSGLGYGPSGTTGAALAELGRGSAQQSSADYLKNLLANEQMKFQAAQGQRDLGGLFNPQPFTGQNMPTNQVTQTTTGSSIGALGQSLGNLLGPGNSGNKVSGQTIGGYTNPNNPLAFGTEGTTP